MYVFDAAAALARVEEGLLLGAFPPTYSTGIGLVPVLRRARGGHGVMLRAVSERFARDGDELGDLLLAARCQRHCRVLQTQGREPPGRHRCP